MSRYLNSEMMSSSERLSANSRTELKPMTALFSSENTDQEISVQDLQAAKGGILILLAALLPGVANAPSQGDGTYTKTSL